MKDILLLNLLFLSGVAWGLVLMMYSSGETNTLSLVIGFPLSQGVLVYTIHKLRR